jgi:hypothetical protein
LTTPIIPNANTTLVGNSSFEQAASDFLTYTVGDNIAQTSALTNFTYIQYYQSTDNLFPFYTGTIGIGPQSTALVGLFYGIGFDLRLNTSIS